VVHSHCVPGLHGLKKTLFYCFILCFFLRLGHHCQNQGQRRIYLIQRVTTSLLVMLYGHLRISRCLLVQICLYLEVQLTHVSACDSGTFRSSAKGNHCIFLLPPNKGKRPRPLPVLLLVHHSQSSNHFSCDTT